MIPTVTLFMIVKNESRIIERCLASVKEHIDYIVITDTGSTDNTVELIENFIRDNGKRGKVFVTPWKDFGHNRSDSFRNMQTWLDEEKIDPATNYGLTIDADMCIEFKDVAFKKRLHEAQGWLMLQKNPHIEYWNMRIMRSDMNYKCVGVTHEYWECSSATQKNNPDVQINDIGDGGCKADKFTRDIALLSKGIEEEPQNVRYMFYLANSYMDNGQCREAVEWYKKRIAAGGWFEEIFIAWRNLGTCYERLQEMDKAVDAWMNAFQHMPQRSETLWRIVQYYRTSGKNQLALLFLRQGIRIPFPKELLLFIETPVYQYRFIEELSIVACYTNLTKEGRLACQFLMMWPNIPEANRTLAKSNNFFYLRPLSEGRRVHRTLTVPVRQPYVTSSSSLFVHPKNKSMSGIVRAVNYSMDDKFNYTARDPEGVVRTINYWCEFKPDGTLINSYEIVYAAGAEQLPKHIVNVRGLEDMRAVWVGKRLYSLAVDREYGTHSHPSVLLCHLEQNEREKTYEITRTVPITYRDNLIQKNWAVFSDGNKLLACYGHHPFTVLEIEPESGAVKVVHESYTGYDLRDVRGSANPIRVPGENSWLFLVHEVAWRDTRKYFHRFLKYNNQWQLTDISEPFYFNQLYVEFSLSIMYDKGKIVIPFSTKDNSSELLTIDYENIPWLPKDLPAALAKAVAY